MMLGSSSTIDDMRATRFCIRVPKESNTTTDVDAASHNDDALDKCYWGLPSISADDPSYPPLGYWQGFVWGPMAQLTWWSLEQYKHLPVANAARKALVDQMTGMFLNQWRLHGHVCENYLPHRNGTKVNGKIWPDECTFGTDTTFYHWGALNGFIAIMGNGYWQSKGQELET